MVTIGKMIGILNINKPQGITSRDAVNQVQRLVRPNKVGHAGTLDPLASGVLLMAIGGASRLVPYLHAYSKCYRGSFIFGQESPSDDVESEITTHAGLHQPTRQEIEETTSTMIGEVMQRPPAYSAIKVKGRRSYDMARQGEAVTLQERPVQINRIQITNYDYPNLELDIDCGTGTYIRSIGRDIAIALGTRAVMSNLVRTSIGSFDVEASVSLDDLDLSVIENNIRPPAEAVTHLENVRLSPCDCEEIRHGRSITLGQESSAAEIAALDESGALIAILISRSDGWGPKRVFKNHA